MNQDELVKRITEEIRGALRMMPPETVHEIILQMVNYHGFGKYRFSKEISGAMSRYQGDVQAELIRVNGDLSHEVHYHEKSRAYVACLGVEESLPNPIRATALIYDGVYCHSGSVFDIPPGMVHGFTVKRGGILYFLSVQTPPIVGGGHDDYHRI